MDKIAENQLRICAEWIEGFEHPTPESVIRHRHEDCVHIQRPRSMGIPIRNNAQYSKYFTKLLIPSLHNFKVNWKVLSNDPTRNILVFFATAHGDSAVGPYDNEYICILRFTQDGTKITQIEEFLDSKFTADFFARLYLASHKKNPPAKL